MEQNLNVLSKCRLFEGIEENDISSMLKCFNVKKKEFKKGQNVFSEGDKAKNFAVVLSGGVQIVKIDYYGNRSIVNTAFPGDIFGEAFACAGVEHIPVDAVALEDSKILLIAADNIATTCEKACPFHNQVILNLLKSIALNNIRISRKIDVTSKRTTREKLMTYLMMQAKNAGRETFTVPFDRQELADYLEVDRSGLSAEISKLRKEGVLECKRSTFTLLRGFV